MKKITLFLFICLALTGAGLVIFADSSAMPEDNFNRMQSPFLPDDEDSGQPLKPGDPNFDTSLFVLETFDLIKDPAYFKDFNDALIRKMPADVFGGFSLEQFKALPPDVFDSFTVSQFSNLLPEVMAGIDRERFRILPSDIIATMTREQTGRLPREAIEGLTRTQLAAARSGEFLGSLVAGNMGGLPTNVISDFLITDFDQLDKTECLKMLAQDLAKLFTNLAQDVFLPADIKACLPPDWGLDESSGALTPPPNSRISLEILPRAANIPVDLEFPDIFNMQSGLAVGGREGNGNVLDEINKVIEKIGFGNQFALMQKSGDGGILILEGLEQFQGVEFAFIPDLNGAYYLGPEAPEASRGISQDPDNGLYRFITENGLSFPLRSAPRNPVKMMQALAEQGVQGMVRVADNGLITVPGLPELPYPFAFMIDMLVTLDPGMGPGLHVNPGGDFINWFVDADGNAQRVYPALPVPEELERVGEALDLDVRHQADGSFTVRLENLGEFLLRPTFDIEARQLAEGEQVTPWVGTNSSGKMAFITVIDKMVLTIRMRVIDPDGNVLDL